MAAVGHRILVWRGTGTDGKDERIVGLGGSGCPESRQFYKVWLGLRFEKTRACADDGPQSLIYYCCLKIMCAVLRLNTPIFSKNILFIKQLQKLLTFGRQLFTLRKAASVRAMPLVSHYYYWEYILSFLITIACNKIHYYVPNSPTPNF